MHRGREREMGRGREGERWCFFSVFFFFFFGGVGGVGGVGRGRREEIAKNERDRQIDR